MSIDFIYLFINHYVFFASPLFFSILNLSFNFLSLGAKILLTTTK